MTTRKELIEALQARYCSAAFSDRIKILDEFGAQTGYHCKHGIRVLRSPFLDSMLLEHFLPMVQRIPDARLLAVGDVPFEAMNWLGQPGHIALCRVSYQALD